MEQLILHLIGDYVTQSDWMANEKTKRSWPAFCHALVYSLPFLLIGSATAVLVIFLTHFAIDRWRLAVFVVYAKNLLLCPQFWRYAFCGYPAGEWGPFLAWDREYQWNNCKATGYPSERPAWLAVWLLIAADNTLHLASNWGALRWL